MTKDDVHSEAARVNAVAFAEAGYPVLPLHGIRGGKYCTCGKDCGNNAGKHPFARLAPHWNEDATTDTDLIESWFAKFPELNYGIRTDQFVVIDVDPKNGGDQEWQELIRDHEDVLTWKVRTGSGGLHIIFDAAGKPVQCGKLAGCAGVDVKSLGGYIVGPGSFHKSGNRYEWIPDCSAYDIEIASVPKWIRDLTKKERGTRERRDPSEQVQFLRDLVSPAVEGERNTKFTRLIGYLFGTQHIDRWVLSELARCLNDLRYDPPLTEEVLDRTILSISGREDRKRGIQ